MEKTFGNLEFAGEDKTEQRRINGRMTVLSRSFNLYSDVQRADDIVVILPAEAGEKHFDFEERVKLVNPRITAEGYKIGTPCISAPSKVRCTSAFMKKTMSSTKSTIFPLRTQR